MFRFSKLVLVILSFSACLFAGEKVFTDRTSNIQLTSPAEQDAVTFAIFGDRTSGKPEGLPVLAQAVEEVNMVSPDFVMTVGDLVQGYNTTEQWMEQTREYKAIMNKLDMPWYPVAGNHDVYWRGDDRPATEHEADYEANFGPLWYSFNYENCCIIVLFSDEGDINTGEKHYKTPDGQIMSDRQKKFLAESLEKAKDMDHVFLFLHHPRWTDEYAECHYGDDWENVHKMLVDAGNVSACFAGHVHKMKYYGNQDGIDYYTLATTGGNLLNDEINPDAGRLHHFDLVTVRGKNYSIVTVPVDSVMDPKEENKVVTVMETVKWSINSEDTRKHSFQFSVPSFEGKEAKVRVALIGAADNTGDRGLFYKLTDCDGKVIREGFSKENDADWIEYDVNSAGDYVMTIDDNDTSFEGKLPGNGGSLMVEMKIQG